MNSLLVLEEERWQRIEEDNKDSEGNLKLASVTNQDSVKECKKDKNDQSLLGSCNEDYTVERRNQQGNGDNNEHYGNVYIGPDSQDEHMEYQYGPDPSDNPLRKKLRCQFVKPKSLQNKYYGMGTKNPDIAQATTKRLLTTCMNLRFSTSVLV